MYHSNRKVPTAVHEYTARGRGGRSRRCWVNRAALNPRLLNKRRVGVPELRRCMKLRRRRGNPRKTEPRGSVFRGLATLRREE